MTFVVWAALAIVGLVVGPLVAHLLRRGRANLREFPGAALVPPLASTARQRSRLEDFTLLMVRSALVVGLALLGATPLVRCDRLSLSRASGASVAIAIVLDDSLSMRSRTPSGVPRFDAARGGAGELLRSARDGDAVAIVLAGQPARIALAPTTDLGAARQALADVAPSDRATALPEAVQLARAALRGLPQKDQRIVVLSDLASGPLPEGTPPVTMPLPDLARPADDCGITSAERRGSRITVAVTCSSDAAARGRSVELVVSRVSGAAEKGPDAGPAARAAPGEVVGHADLSPRRGEQTVALALGAAAVALDARLTGTDALEHDDTAPVALESAAPRVGVVSDAATGSAKTGGATLVEQALVALGDAWVVQPLPFVPDDERALGAIGALILDDPRGFSPEARAAAGRFLERGGVALALLGPRSVATDLGSALEPFARGAARWEPVHDLGIDPLSAPVLGPEAASLSGIARRGRVRLDGMEIDGARVVGRWNDSVPWLLERRVGRGLAVTAGLPTSLEESDLGVRTGFLALLDHVLRQADVRSGSRRTVAGTEWSFPEAKQVSIEGPEGRVSTSAVRSDQACQDGEPCDGTLLRATGNIRGRYTVRVDGEIQARIVTIDPEEILGEPHPELARTSLGAGTGNGPALVNGAHDLSIALIALFALELAIRLVRRFRAGSRGSAGDPAPST